MKNVTKKLTIFFFLFTIFLLLIFFNLTKAQQDIASSKTPQYTTTLLDSPTLTSINKPVNFSWNVVAPNTANTTLTTIYYGFVSTPSALTIKDSPQAVGYPQSLSDYQNGRFFLPDTFSASTSFLKGTVYYRAYALVGNQHLWSPETKLVIK
jgi:hypothetical protein